MRHLFELDAKDYDPNGTVFRRDSARAVCVRGGYVALVYSARYHYYKFPGGGIEPGETPAQAMMREAMEEAGLVVIPDSVKEYGLVPRREKGDREDIFAQDNLYYLCRAEEELCPACPDAYEAEEGFCLRWMRPGEAIRVNRANTFTDRKRVEAEREARVLECLIAEGLFRENA